ncbi:MULTISPECIES: penicillin-binding protein [Rhodococcus]|uniref:Transglycosylase domain-containing protein n=1 Tax=Rhodococcus pyridinivorans TaxID=103816 RepID=A0A7M2XTP9_9NOCA|nr:MULTISPECIES: transglycosylase domain-containing protein [Rhodococcus]MBX4170956.1 transglycosylase domain-containing protein [Rhodococcus sp. DMU2021]QOW01038.1 transglycosylase domain-containing protein [Rhodococcus pyridinivorans]QXF83751.1 PASTA domain-containing protein [Rhodococcus pyridinivorans]WMM74969.1 transglycosylase domain-containing protein [Rhodococcus pyridinivorans]
MAKLAGCTALGGVLVAGMLFPAAGGFGYVSNRAADTVDNSSAELVEGVVPAVTTMVDKAGEPIAWLYDQRRFEVPSDQISNEMKLAIVSIEDKRFPEHQGVDWQGTIRAFLTNTTSGQVEQGASTIDQQYVKNYLLHVIAKTDAERRAAIETTPARKIREIRMALTLDDQLTKDEILTRYLNLVPFGNGSFGIQDAAQTYFGIDAKDLNIPQAAMLAGMVQSSSALNPYTNPDGVLARRNIVLDTMIDNIPERADEIRAAKELPLGVLPEPNTLPRGCIAADDRGYFCEYALQYLENSGLSREQIDRGGYLIRTTLDPEVQNSVKESLDRFTSPTVDDVASVMNVIEPGQDSHKVLAMGSSRKFGLDAEAKETVQPQPYSLAGHGAGSIFKIFTVAAAMEQGLGTSAVLDVPSRYNARGLGDGGARGCPANYYCVENAAPYPSRLSVTDALAQSPNTAFVKLIEATGVDAVVDMSVRLGLRSYLQPRTSGFGDQSMAEMQKNQHLGSYTLGPTWINALELSNVAATLASHGKWCPPSPIEEVFDREGKPVPITQQACEQAVEPGLADTLATAMSKDTSAGGTASGAAGSVGWNLPVAAKTGTTESHMSSAFLGFTNRFAGVVYTYGDSPTPGQICSGPVRPCYDGNLFGGTEPARTWFSAMLPVANKFGSIELPAPDPRYVRGAGNAQVPDVTGLSKDRAVQRLQDAGFSVSEATIAGEERAGTVTGTSPSGSAVPGSTVTLFISDGSVRVAPTTSATPARPRDREVPDTTRRSTPAPIPGRELEQSESSPPAEEESTPTTTPSRPDN